MNQWGNGPDLYPTVDFTSDLLGYLSHVTLLPVFQIPIEERGIIITRGMLWGLMKQFVSSSWSSLEERRYVRTKCERNCWGTPFILASQSPSPNITQQSSQHASETLHYHHFRTRKKDRQQKVNRTAHGALLSKCQIQLGQLKALWTWRHLQLPWYGLTEAAIEMLPASWRRSSRKEGPH